MKNLNKIRLMYYMWVPEGFLDGGKNTIFKFHLECLKEFSNIFNDVIFFLAVDGNNYQEKVNYIEKCIIDINFDANIKFEIIENNKYLREGKVFYDELLMKASELDGITFFAHSKGMDNIDNRYDLDKESLYEWICAMYYLNLSTIEQVKRTLIGDFRICYGALLSTNTMMWKKLMWQYNGSFLWINTKKFNNYIKENGIFIPECVDRTYAEATLGKIIPFDFNYIESFELRYIDSDKWQFNTYVQSDDVIRAVLSEDYYNEFMAFFNNIRGKVLNNEE